MKKILYQSGFLKFSKKKLQNWFALKDTSMLQLALVKGNFNIRTMAANLLGALKDSEAIPHLAKAIHDKVEIASFASINALLKIGVDDKLKKEINEKIQYWEQKKINKTHSATNHVQLNTPKWNKKVRSKKRNFIKQIFKNAKKKSSY